VPEAGDEAFRELLVYSYRVIYRVEKQRVTIEAIAHGILTPKYVFGDEDCVRKREYLHSEQELRPGSRARSTHFPLATLKTDVAE